MVSCGVGSRGLIGRDWRQTAGIRSRDRQIIESIDKIINTHQKIERDEVRKEMGSSYLVDSLLFCFFNCIYTFGFTDNTVGR